MSMPAMTCARQAFRDAMAAVAAPVHVITTAGPAGQAGITATAFTALTDEPPMVLVCLNRQSYAAGVVQANRRLAVNCLGPAHAETAARFAGKGQLSMPERFAAEPGWTHLASGAPVLPEAVAIFDCEVDSMVEMGTHWLCHCRVLEARAGAGEGLLYQGRTFKTSAMLQG